MSGNDNVIPMEDSTLDGVTRQVLRRKLLARCKQICLAQLRRILQAMFDGADDALFKMAEHAEEHCDTNPFFDSMRVVRIQRETIEQHFFQALENKLDAFRDRHEHHDKQHDLAEIDYDSLELVSEDDLEIRLATQHLVQKIQSLYTEALYALNRRLAWLDGKEEIDDNCIPFSAETLVQAYASATEDVNFIQEVRIILLKLFDWSCIQGLADMYAQINQTFIDANVLPVIKTNLRKNDSANTPSYTAVIPAPGSLHQQASLQTIGMENSLWGTLQAYLSQPHAGLTMTPGNPPIQSHDNTSIPLAPVSYAEQGKFTTTACPTPFTAQDLIDPLTILQQDVEGALPEGGAHAVGNYVRVQLQTDADNGNQEQRQLSPVDNDLIDVVCLLFEYILYDPQLPQTAKASLRRLQIPMLKVALLDKSFFSMHGHPARDLLNMLARAALGIDKDDEEDLILAKIDDIVQHIIEDFRDDIALFSELKQELENFMQSQQQKASSAITELERRQQEREEIALARSWVRETLEQHLLGRTLPPVVIDIILGPWKDVMLQTYVQEGEDSLLWKTQIRFIDVLCWSVQPKQVVLDKNKLGNIIRQLINTLREGLDLIDYPKAEVDAIFAALEPYHLASVRGVMSITGEQENEAPTQAISATENESSMMQADDEDTNLTQQSSDAKVILEDIVLEGWESDPMLDAINDEYLELARHLEMGKWVEFQNDHGERRHAKLAWKSELLGEYTFLNWKFDVVADKTLLELAADLRQGKARVVDDVPLMDRALSSVLTTLIPKPR